jgi:glycosyltransferase
MSARFHGELVPDAPKVSIVTPAYQSASYLEHALASVESAADGLSVEHVVADGGSDDGSLDMLRQAPLVRGWSEPDNGLYDAVWRAIESARGEFVQWVNADDALPEAFLSRALERFDDQPQLDAVVGDTVFMDADGRAERVWRYAAGDVFDPRSQAGGYFANINSIVFRRSTLLRAGRFRPELFSMAADIDMLIRFGLLSVRAAVLHEPAYCFRRHEGSLTGTEGAMVENLANHAAVYEYWSHESSASRELRRLYRDTAALARLGRGLKLARLPSRRLEGLRELGRLTTTRPLATLRAFPEWLRERRVPDRRLLDE